MNFVVTNLINCKQQCQICAAFLQKPQNFVKNNVDLTRFFTTRCKTLPTILLNLKKFCTKKPKTCKTTILNLTRYFRKNPDVLQKNVESDSD